MKNASPSLISSFSSHPPIFAELPLKQIESDPNQPRKTFGTGSGRDYNRLLNSILYYGIEDPIKVSKISERRYLIIDGHRRFSCATEVNLNTVPCRIYPQMSSGELEARRFEIQNNRREWRTIEKANAVHKIKAEYKDASAKDIAQLLGINQQNLFQLSQVRDLRLEYLELMSEHNLKEYQKLAFMILLPRLRRVGKFQVDEIVKILFEKIDRNLIKQRSDFTALGKLFLAASFHEDELIRFLSDPHLSVTELAESYKLSGISLQISRLTEELTLRKNQGGKITEGEKEVFDDLYSLMKTLW